MKFRIIATIVLLVLLLLGYVIQVNNQSPASTVQPANDGIVIR